MKMHLARLALLIVTALVTGAAPTAGQTLSGRALVERLQRGGCVLVMRHASSPSAPPDKKSADPGNTKLERQLDGDGRAAAAAMGRALRTLKIPVGPVLSSPTYRAMETARLMQLPRPHATDELGDGGQSMGGVSPGQRTWLEDRVRQAPPGASNMVLITHMPNIRAAFPQWSSGLGDGETLVLAPDGRGGVTLLARVKMTEWSSL